MPASRDSHKKVEHSTLSHSHFFGEDAKNVLFLFYPFTFLSTKVFQCCWGFFCVLLFVLIFILTGWCLDNFSGHRFKVISYQDRWLHFLCSCSGWKNLCVLPSILRLAYLSGRLWGVCLFGPKFWTLLPENLVLSNWKDFSMWKSVPLLWKSFHIS